TPTHLCVSSWCSRTPATAPAAPSTLSLHDALPISLPVCLAVPSPVLEERLSAGFWARPPCCAVPLSPCFLSPLLKSRDLSLPSLDRKSTRLNSSHVSISYAVFCLKKKKQHKSHTGN